MSKNSGKIKKILISILVPILIVVLIAGSFFAIIDGMVNIVESFIAKVTSIASDLADTSVSEVLSDWGKLSNIIDEAFIGGNDVFDANELAKETMKNPTIIMSQTDFDNIKNNIDLAKVNRDTAGLEDYMLKVMLLAYYRSVYLSDFDILMEITDENDSLPEGIKSEKELIEEMNAEADADPDKKHRCPFEIVEGNATAGIGEDGNHYLKTTGMIKIETTVEDLEKKDGSLVEKELKYYDKGVLDGLIKMYQETDNPDYAYSIKEFLKTTYTNSTKSYGEILICTIDDTTTTTKYIYDDPDIEYEITETKSGEATYMPINYDIVSAKYGTPVEFLLNLLEITGSRDFLNAFISVACSSDYYIKLGLYDLTTRTTNITQETYTEDIQISGTVDTSPSYTVKSVISGYTTTCQKGIHYKTADLDDGQTVIYITDSNTTGKTYYLYKGNLTPKSAYNITADINDDGVNENYLGWKEDLTGGVHDARKTKVNANVTTITTEVINEQYYDIAIKEVRSWWATITKEHNVEEIVTCTNITEDGKKYVEDENLDNVISSDKAEGLFKDSNNYILETIDGQLKTTDLTSKIEHPNVFKLNTTEEITGREGLLNKLFNKIVNDSSIEYVYGYTGEQDTIEDQINNNGITQDDYQYDTITLFYDDDVKIKTVTIENRIKTSGGALKGNYELTNILKLLKHDVLKEPIGDNIVEYGDLYNSETGAGEMLENGAEMLFQLLDSSENTEGLSEIMRYLLYLYNGKDYGVTSPELNIYDLQGISTGRLILGDSIEDKVWISLTNMGFTKIAVAGVMGNIYAESGFNPDIIEKGSGLGFGLCQWTGSRRSSLELYAASKGVDASDVNTQIEFLMGELSESGEYGGCGGYATYQLKTTDYSGTRYTPSDWKDATSVEQATKAFCFTFERPDADRANMPTRLAKAEEYYQKYINTTMEELTGTNEIQLKIAEIAQNSKEYGITPKEARCLGWVYDVYEKAGAAYGGADCAFCGGYNFGVSTDFSNVPIGAAIYGESPNTEAGRKYGHVGIYIGNGQVRDNAGGYIRKTTLEEFITKHPNGCWGWASTTPVNASYPVTQGLMKNHYSR